MQKQQAHAALGLHRHLGLGFYRLMQKEILMDENQLRKLLAQDEGLKLDFKREYQIGKVPVFGSDPQLWKQMVEGQWQEILKDIISLANGNVGVPNETGYLVIGADNTLRADGTRQLFDTRHLGLDTQHVNSSKEKGLAQFW